MKTAKKLLVTVIAAVVLAESFGSTAFAAESDSIPVDQPEGQSEDGTVTGMADGEPVLEEGYFMDEQGQVYYDPSIVTPEEPVINDTVDEDIPDITAEDSSEEEDKDSTADKKEAGKALKEESKAKAKKPSYTEAELRLLSCLVYAEAGNQSYAGMLGVANVVLNRVKSDVFWHVNTIKEVIYDHKWSVQFSVTIKNSKTGQSSLDKALKNYDTGKYSGANPTAEKKAMDKATKAAKAALEGSNNIGSYLCFSNKSCASYVKKHYSKYEIIDDTIFYRTK